jgi:hypothetical protein
MTRQAHVRTLASASLLGLVVALVSTVVGHLGLGPGYNPLKLTVSDYALSNRGTAIDIAMVALALGALALLAGFRAAGARVAGLPALLVSIWSTGLIVAAIVPTDPATATSMSTAAYVHRYASVTAFIVLPIAAVALASRLPGSATLRLPVRRLAIGCAVGLAVLWYDAFPGGRFLMGLIERGLIGLEITVLAVLSVGVLRALPKAGCRLPVASAYH